MATEDILGGIAAMLFCLVMGSVWTEAFVLPHDAHNRAVSACMGKLPASTPKAHVKAHKVCHSQLIGQAGGIVGYFYQGQ